LLWLLGVIPLSSYAGDLNVLLVLSNNSAPYQYFAKSFQQELPANIHVSVLQKDDGFTSDDKQVDLIVTVGVSAVDWIVTRTTKPVLATMVPSYIYTELLAKHPALQQLSAIFIDQPWERQINFLRAVLPEHKRIGLLYSKGMHFDKAELNKLLTRHGATLIEKTTDSDGALFNDLESILSESDVLLAVPDSAVYNSNNIRNILLESYRHGVPLVGLSQSYVDAGAVCAIFSTVKQLAVQSSENVILFAKTRQLSNPQYPVTFTIAFNQQVARSLEIELPSKKSIRHKMDSTQVRKN
jgi:putative ABC transport system substrate-binding protein